MTAAPHGDDISPITGEPAAPALNSTGRATSCTPTDQTGTYRASRETLDRWPFSLAVAVALSAPAVVKQEA